MERLTITPSDFWVGLRIKEKLYADYGITGEELLKPTKAIVEKVQEHLSKGDEPKTRLF